MTTQIPKACAKCNGGASGSFVGCVACRGSGVDRADAHRVAAIDRSELARVQAAIAAELQRRREQDIEDRLQDEEDLARNPDLMDVWGNWR